MKPTSLSLRDANLLYFFTMLLVIVLGSLVQTWNLSLGLIATEFVLILAPALLWLRARRVPLRKGLRLRPLPWLTALLCLGLGVAVFLFSAVIEGVMAQLTGMASVSLPEGTLPSGTLESVLFFIALGVSAPLCEEVLFRGAIQGAYCEARFTPRTAILVTGLMFAFYHFRLSGLPALLPVALILGCVVWRTGSLYAGMLVHFGVNGMSAANTLAALNGSPNGLGLVTLWSGLGGLAAAGAILYAIHRLHRGPAPQDAPLAASLLAGPRPSFLAVYWPLFAGGLLYLGVIGLTLAASLPGGGGPVASTPVKYFPPQIDRPLASAYQITNRAGDVVGEMTCRLTPQTAAFSVDCQRTVRGFELRTQGSYYFEVDHTASWSATWDARTLDLQAFSFTRKSVTGGGFSAALAGTRLSVTGPDGEQTLVLSEPYLLEYEWAWRAAALQVNSGERYTVPFGRFLFWDPQLQKSAPALNPETLVVGPFETLNLPAGRFEARKISIAGQSTWYAVPDNNIPRLVQWDDGMLIYSLEK